jgi:hypothetical protein
MKLFEQIERHMQHHFGKSKPWKSGSKSCKFVKKLQHRVNRREAKLNPECLPTYRKYQGWEF